MPHTRSFTAVRALMVTAAQQFQATAFGAQQMVFNCETAVARATE